jgi:hypothetical protein
MTRMVTHFEKGPHVKLCPSCFKAMPCEKHPDPAGCEVKCDLVITGVDRENGVVTVSAPWWRELP